jgi:hypothetical protein
LLASIGPELGLFDIQDARRRVLACSDVKISILENFPFRHKLVKIALTVIFEVAFIFIRQNILVLADKANSHFPTFIYVNYNNYRAINGIHNS